LMSITERVAELSQKLENPPAIARTQQRRGSLR
jgi:hypothetical protein